MKRNVGYFKIILLGFAIALFWMFTTTETFSQGTGIIITTDKLNDAIIDVPYDLQMAATGYSGVSLWEIVGGGPAWLMIDSANGNLYGTPGPGDAGDETIVISIRDEDGKGATKDFVLRVSKAMVIPADTLADGFEGEPYSERILLQGGNAPFAFSKVRGDIPTGLALDNTTGIVSGTPSKAGFWAMDVKVSDSSRPDKQTVLKNIGIAVTNTMAILTPGDLPEAVMQKTVGTVTLVVKGGQEPYSWAITEGFLPEGVALDSATGEITGTPKDKGDFIFTVLVTDGNLTTAVKSFQLHVSEVLHITNTPPEAIAQGKDFRFAFLTSGGTPPFVWEVSKGSLPEGVTLNKETGTLYGMPTNPKAAAFTARVSDSSTVPQVSEKTFKILVTSDLVISTQTLPDGKINKLYPQSTVSAALGTLPYSFSITAGTLPDGLNLANGPDPEAKTIKGKPTKGGHFPFTVTITDAAGKTAVKAFSIEIVPDEVQIKSTSLGTACREKLYSDYILAEGGKKPYSWQIIGGQLPLGLSLNSVTGRLSGIPVPESQTSSFTILVADSASSYSTREFTIPVPDPLDITTTALSGGGAGRKYKDVLKATGGLKPYTWSLTNGSLPAGLTLNPNGTISGTPTASGKYPFGAEVKDTSMPAALTAQRNFTIAVVDPLVVATTALPGAGVGRQYKQIIEAAGGQKPYTWSLESGNLPTGLTLDANGIISGTPTESGSFKFAAGVQDALRPDPLAARKNFIIAVVDSLAIATTTLPDGAPGRIYKQVIEATGGQKPYTWSLEGGSLPAGLTLDASGIISGTPTESGSFKFAAGVQDGATPPQKAKQPFEIMVVKPLAITDTTLPVGEVNVSYNKTLNATGGKGRYTWSIKSGSALPSWLSLTKDGVLTGTPTASGTFTFKVEVHDEMTPQPLKAEQKYIIQVVKHVNIVTDRLPKGEGGMAYTKPDGTPAQLLASGGFLSEGKDYTWEIVDGSLPAGLRLDSHTGIISGTPDRDGNGSFTFTARVKDTLEPDGATATLTIEVKPHVAVITTKLDNYKAEIGVPYSQVFEADMGWRGAGYKWSLGSGSLPPGLSLKENGVLSGTLSAKSLDSYKFTVLVTDSLAPQAASAASREFTIQVAKHVGVTTTKLDDDKAEIGVPYSQRFTAALGWPGYTWSIKEKSRNEDVAIDANGVFSFTPKADGPFTFTVEVKDSLTPDSGTAASKQFTIQVAKHIVVTTNKLAYDKAEVGAPYPSQTFTADLGWKGHTWFLNSGSLPLGVKLTEEGVLAGTPHTDGTFTFTVGVKDPLTLKDWAATSQEFTIQVAKPVVVTVDKLDYENAEVGMPYPSFTFTADQGWAGSGYTWSLKEGSLPPGMRLTKGVLSGTPSEYGAFAFTVEVKDSLKPAAATGTSRFAIRVVPKLEITMYPVLPAAKLNNLYSVPLTVWLGYPEYTWFVNSGSLPPGMNLSKKGVLAGTPRADGKFIFTIGVKDSLVPNPATAIRKFSIVVVK